VVRGCTARTFGGEIGAGGLGRTHVVRREPVPTAHEVVDRLLFAYRVFDLVIVPTSSSENGFIELFGRVLPEAMLCKTDVIGSDNGSIPEVIHNPALVFRQNDPAALRDKIVS
jgi:glycosyltransferase involved in cell wall biosynthesis